VDVDLGRTTGGQSVANTPRYDKLVAAGAATGWRSYSRGRSGEHTWHFSFGVVA
jgi:hypothetical protein